MRLKISAPQGGAGSSPAPGTLAPLILVLLGLAACQQGPIPANGFRSRIINGTPDTVHVAVVDLDLGGGFCSGTLIAPRAVLTAGHCLEGPIGWVKVFFGDAMGGPGTTINAVWWGAHPSFKDTLPWGTLEHDVAMIILEKDGPVTPMAWQSTPLPNMIGQTGVMVGYGVTDAANQTGSGGRRQVSLQILDQDAKFLYYGDGSSGTCQGDSGGPTLFNSVVAAVTSFGASDCVTDNAATRVDTHASFINQAMAGCTCSVRTCGTDCWGAPCGTCTNPGDVCDPFTSQCAPCKPACTGRQCGNDGCGGVCGTCSGGGSCNPSGQCVALCKPSCDGKECGADGCGGSCGMCGTGKLCDPTTQRCAQSCTPACGAKKCGDDGCGGSCGSCGGGAICSAGQCVPDCTPDCTGKQCGPDGCGGSCGSCGDSQLCSGAGQCTRGLTDAGPQGERQPSKRVSGGGGCTLAPARSAGGGATLVLVVALLMLAQALRLARAARTLSGVMGRSRRRTPIAS
jgi:V8-like Glu-specific endopeptidase